MKLFDRIIRGCTGAGAASLLIVAGAACTSRNPGTEMIPEVPGIIHLGEGIPVAELPLTDLAVPSIGNLDRISAGKYSSVFEFGPLHLDGNQYEIKTDDALILPGDALQLNSGDGIASWGLYRFSGSGIEEQPGFVETLLSDAPPQIVYIGLSNYTKGSWEWLALNLPDLTGDQGLFSRSLESGDDYFSESGSLFIVIICWGGSSCSIQYNELFTGMRQVYVTGLTASDGEYTDWIQVDWDVYPGSAEYELYYRLTAFPGTLSLLTTLNGESSNQFLHSATAPPGRESEPGTEYIYFIMAVFEDGYRSRLSGWDTGFR